MTHTCQNCGAVADDPGHLCNPIREHLSCEFCGAKDVSSTHVCKEKMAAMKYSCTTCGRVATDSSHLCSPGEIA